MLMKILRSSILYCFVSTLLLFVVWISISAPATPQDGKQINSDGASSYVLSQPTERPFAIEQNSSGLIVPSISARQWSETHVQGILNDIARRKFTARKQAIKRYHNFGVSLPPELISFPFSVFW